MASEPKLPLPTTVVPFDKFWTWLQVHPNCILSAGTPETVLYDDDDLHWHLAVDDESTLLVQVIRGKQLLGEIAIVPRQIAYVQVEAKAEEEFIFECIVENESERVAAYHFTMSHEYDAAEETPKTGRWVH